MGMIKRLIAFDFDGTLGDSPMPEDGKVIWKQKTGQDYPHKGWWGRPESLDLGVFDIKMFPSVLNQLKREVSTPDTYVIILTSRLERLRPQLKAVLDANGVHVNAVDMKHNELTKGEKILRYIDHLPDLEEVSVYEDREGDIASYQAVRDRIPEGITFNIYLADNGKFGLTEVENNDKLTHIIMEEIVNFADGSEIYHGTHVGAAISIQREGKMRLNTEPYFSFTSQPRVAKYYAEMKGGKDRAVILRTQLTDDFKQSPKFDKKDGYEWITAREIPSSELEVMTSQGWITLNKWDFIDKEIKT
jgi:hypothetical protein